MNKKALILIILLSTITIAQAKVVQIIHTNDLHSYFNGTRTLKGGYARLKTLVDKLRAEALKKNIPSIHLDAGDFGEGTSFFMSNEGVDSLRALDILGVDATVIGNHDHMLGGFVLANQIKKANLQSKMLSANIEGKKLLGLDNLVDSRADFNLDGIKIRVFGLSTSEIHFQYPLIPRGFISPSIMAGQLEERKAKRDDVDFLIALTHIGLRKDIKLIHKTKEVDLVVGGHSHTRLDDIHYEKNKAGKYIPIVQTGANGLAVGSLYVDIKGKNDYEIIDYRLHDVTLDLEENQTMVNLVTNALESKNSYFGRQFTEVIGSSEIPLSGYIDGQENDQTTCWGEHIAKMSKEAVGADIGLHLAMFEGESIPAGPIRFGDIVDNFPHFRAYGDQGWQIATIKLRGFWIRKIFEFLASKPGFLGINFYGENLRTTDLPPSPLSQDQINRFMGGKFKLSNFKRYKVAFPSEVAYAIEKTFPFLKGLVLPKLEISNAYYWPVMENYLRENSPIACLTE
jgi:2',3'-cyclic-nucleotide 2'-phosphodiesterase (5'-nucleotidase family)